MKTSSQGRALIEQREGRRLTAYRDSVGVWTIGVGHTGRMAAPLVSAGMTITEAECDAYLAADLAPVEAAINAALKVPVTQNEFDAMASLWFNTGIGYVKTSAIIKRLNLGDIVDAADGFDAYHKPAGIIGRRNGEKAQFLAPDATTATVLVTRANTLSTMAVAATSAAKTAVVATSTSAIGGTVVTAGLAVGSSPTAAAAVGGVTILGALLGGILAWLRAHRAIVLTDNADAQRIAAL